MLYVTTRNQRDFFTAHHTLIEDRGINGGFYIPFRNVTMDSVAINALQGKPFNQCVADVMNLFFSARLDALDIDFCIGKYPVRLIPMSHKIVVAETWNHRDWDFLNAVRSLNDRILGDKSAEKSSNWMQIAARVAVLVGIISELQRFGVVSSKKSIDISVSAGDLASAVAVCYGRQMGLPIGKLIISSEESGIVWDLLHGGVLPTNKQILPENLERFIYTALGLEPCERFVHALSSSCAYTLDESEFEKLKADVFSAVVSKKRIQRVIANVYKTNAYILHPDSALAYGGLQDYRATEAEASPALILSEKGPQCDAMTVATALGISTRELEVRMNT